MNIIWGAGPTDPDRRARLVDGVVLVVIVVAEIVAIGWLW